jgi:hypothetical protein
MALKVSYTEIFAPPFNTGQPIAILTASSNELAFMTEYPVAMVPIGLALTVPLLEMSPQVFIVAPGWCNN